MEAIYYSEIGGILVISFIGGSAPFRLQNSDYFGVAVVTEAVALKYITGESNYQLIGYV